jgi:hypothetical protein
MAAVKAVVDTSRHVQWDEKSVGTPRIRNTHTTILQLTETRKIA